MASKRILSCQIFLLIIFSWFCASHHALGGAVLHILYQGGDALDSSSTLVSRKGLFTLGFVRLGYEESYGSYLGIWKTIDDYSDEGHPFWLANREKHIADNSGVLAIDGSGGMKLSFSGGDLVQFYSSTHSSTTNLTAILEDSGNFVLKDANSPSGEILWQSFDYPTDTFLPGMKLGTNRRTGKAWSLTSWLSEKVPAPGAFTFEWEPNGQELVIKLRGEIYWSSGPLRGNASFENFEFRTGLRYGFFNVSNADEDDFIYMAAKDHSGGQFSKWKLDSEGKLTEESNGIGIAGVMCDGYNTKMGCVRRDNEEHTCRGRARFEWRSGSFSDGEVVEVNATLISISDCMDRCWKDCRCAGICAECYNNNTGCKFLYGKFLHNLPPGMCGRVEYEKHYVITRETTGGKGRIWISVSVAAIVLMMAIKGVWLYRRKKMKT